MAAQSPRVRTRALPSKVPQSSVTELGQDCLRDRKHNLRLEITYQNMEALRPAPRRVRRRERGQIDQIAANINANGCLVPILVTAAGEVIHGQATLDACKRLGHRTVPTIIVDHLDHNEVRALRIWLNKSAEKSTWIPEALALEFQDLLKVDPDIIGLTGFTMPQVEYVLRSSLNPHVDEPTDISPLQSSPISRHGDLWVFEGDHKLLCTTARAQESYGTLLGSERVQMVFTDPPFGCKITGHVSHSHGEFVEGSGMDESEAVAFFESFLTPMVEHVADGAIVDICIDARSMFALQTALRKVGLNQKDICVWDKGNGGMGSLYRHSVEFVLITKWGSASHINNVQLGRYDRNRNTLWEAPGYAQFGPDRDEALALHPTVKPVGLVADALLDTSNHGGIILDPFCGSGTTLVACHRTGRVGRGIELDPIYVDVAIRRMEAATGTPARLAENGLTFAEVARVRAPEILSSSDAINA